MSDRLDRVLRAIDSGLQRTTEASYGTDTHPEMCARCQRARPDGGADLCGGCRAFLLGDGPDDGPDATIPIATMDGSFTPSSSVSAAAMAADVVRAMSVSPTEAQRRLTAALAPGGAAWPSAMRSSELPPGHVWVWNQPATQWEIRSMADPFREPVAAITLEFARWATPNVMAQAVLRSAGMAWREAPARSSIDLASAYAAVGISVAMAASRVMRSAYEVWRDEVGLVNPPNAETSPDVQ